MLSGKMKKPLSKFWVANKLFQDIIHVDINYVRIFNVRTYDIGKNTL